MNAATAAILFVSWNYLDSVFIVHQEMASVRIVARLRLDLTSDEEYEEGLPKLIATLRAPVHEVTPAG